MSMSCEDDSDCAHRLICVKNATWQGYPAIRNTSRCECYYIHGWQGAKCDEMGASFSIALVMRFLLVVLFVGMLGRLWNFVFQYRRLSINLKRKYRSVLSTACVVIVAQSSFLVQVILAMEDSFRPDRYFLKDGFKLPQFTILSAGCFAFSCMVSFLACFQLSLTWVDLGYKISHSEERNLSLSIYVFLIWVLQLVLLVILTLCTLNLDFILFTLAAAPFSIVLVLNFSIGSQLISGALNRIVFAKDATSVSDERRKNIRTMVDRIQFTSRSMLVGLSMAVFGGFVAISPILISDQYANRRLDSGENEWKRFSSWGSILNQFALGYSHHVITRYLCLAIQGSGKIDSRETDPIAARTADVPNVTPPGSEEKDKTKGHVASKGVTDSVVTPAKAKAKNGIYGRFNLLKMQTPTELSTVHSVVSIAQESSPQLLNSGDEWKNASHDAWVEQSAPDGLSFYLNTVTGATSFDPPPKYTPLNST